MASDATRRINAALNASLADADLKDRFQRLGAQVQPDTPEAFAQVVQRDRAKWAQIVAQRRITLDS